MNVYDFDNTIYDGESIVDFYFFLLKENPRLISLLPKMMYMLARYKLCRISEEELTAEAQRYAAVLIHYAADKKAITEFWDKNIRKIKCFYLENKKPDDVVISSGCSFLLKEVCARLEIKHLIASEINIKTGEIERVCFRGRKPTLFREYFPDGKIDNFYTDSMNDKPMFEISDRVYMVKGNKIKEMIK